mmetsp:Transcript_54609/g.119114  ORF Transcript_54609/g.119114 Transcript_54609/m.119114 type:complete len:221 (+) Transcript_54609:822-1484(+)
MTHLLPLKTVICTPKPHSQPVEIAVPGSVGQRASLPRASTLLLIRATRSTPLRQTALSSLLKKSSASCLESRCAVHLRPMHTTTCPWAFNATRSNVTWGWSPVGGVIERGLGSLAPSLETSATVNGGATPSEGQLIASDAASPSRRGQACPSALALPPCTTRPCAARSVEPRCSRAVVATAAARQRTWQHNFVRSRTRLAARCRRSAAPWTARRTSWPMK